MKLFLAIVASSAASSLAFSPAARPARGVTALNAKVGIYYSTQTGNTETVAGYIAEAAGGLDLEDIGDTTEAAVQGLDSIIVGAPTWVSDIISTHAQCLLNMGAQLSPMFIIETPQHTDSESERSGTEWDSWLYNTLPNLDLAGKKVAVFGVGDQQSYNEYYCDAAGELYDLFEKAGCKMMGFTSTEGYDHSNSKAERDGKFVGLMCDEDNQYDLSEERAKAWVEQLKGEGFF
ncbi:hypothetical protein ACHAWF_003884 [Thalassiosira exigua]